MSKKIDTIIIGQGLAGSLLAFELEKKSKDFLVIDNNHKHASSIVAAGLYNPVVFRKPTLGFNISNVLPFALNKYEELESVLAKKFLYKRPYWKFFENFKTINNWEAKAADEKFKEYIKLPLKKEFINGVENELPYAETKFTGNVDLPLFLEESRAYFESKKCLINSELVGVNYGFEIELKLSTNESYKCNRLLLARGHQEGNKPEFAYSKVGATKGDILTIKCPDLKCDRTLSRGFFILPIGNDLYKVGATYDWEDKSYVPSETAKMELAKRFENLVNLPYEIIKHETGLRPGANDRRPLIGNHPEHKNLFILNGLGSKGVLLGPYYANQLVNHIFEEQPIDDEVNVERMRKYYGNIEN